MSGFHASDLTFVGAALLCILLGVGIIIGKVPPSGIEQVRDKARYRVHNGRLSIAVGMVMMLVSALRMLLPFEQGRIAITAIAVAGVVALGFAAVPILRMRNPKP